MPARRLTLALFVLGLTGGPGLAVAANPLVHQGDAYLVAEHIGRWSNPTERIWSASTAPGEGELATDGERLYLAGSSGIRALDLADGKPIWQSPLEGRGFAPVVDQGRILVTTTAGILTALDPATGEAIWQRRFEGWVYPPALVENTLITGGQAGRLWGLDPTTGETRWSRVFDQQLVAGPLATEDGGLVSTFDGALTKIAPKTGKTLWKTRLPTPTLQLSSIRNRLIAGGYDRRLHALAAADGALLWKAGLRDRPAGILPLADGGLAVTDVSDNLYRLDSATGHILERRQLPEKVVGLPVLWQGRATLFLRNSGDLRPWRPESAAFRSDPNH